MYKLMKKANDLPKNDLEAFHQVLQLLLYKKINTHSFSITVFYIIRN